MDKKTAKVRYVKFAKKLVALREKYKMTDKELAERCGVDRRTIVEYERGISVPYGETAQAMEKFFCMPIEKLLCVKYPKAEQELCRKADDFAWLYGRSARKDVFDFLTPKESDDSTMTDDGYVISMQAIFGVMVMAREIAHWKYTPKKYRRDDTAAEIEERRQRVRHILPDFDYDNVMRSVAKHRRKKL